MINIKNKKILFISPSFFGYEISIKKRLVEVGAIVDYFDERPANTFWTKALIRINRGLLSSHINKYYEIIYQKIVNHSYDYIFVMDVEAMPTSFLKKIKKSNPSSIFILYLWDSIYNKKHTINYLSFFDHIYSFDPNDCKNNPILIFRPLFFLNEYKTLTSNKEQEYEYDFSFIGTAHSDRYALIQKIYSQIQDYCLKSYWYLYLQNWKMFYWNKLTNQAFRKAHLHDFHYSSLSKKEVIEVIRKSRIIIDIQHPKQSGLTMRTIEMLGAQRKLVTTNASVKNYDFYSEDNILVIDRENPVIDEFFCLREYRPLKEYLYYKYSLDGWLEEIFK